MRKWTSENREQSRLTAANSRARSYDTKISRDRAYYAANRDDINARKRERLTERREEVNSLKRARYAANRERLLPQLRASFERRFARDPERVRAVRTAYAARLRATNEKYLLNGRVSALMRQSLKPRGIYKDGRTWEILVGYTLEQLVEHLRSTLPEGCSWQDYLDGKLHIDHIIPIAAFSYSSIDDLDFKRCWALSNLRLFPAIENMRKGARILEPFQPALLVGIG